VGKVSFRRRGENKIHLKTCGGEGDKRHSKERVPYRRRMEPRQARLKGGNQRPAAPTNRLAKKVNKDTRGKSCIKGEKGGGVGIYLGGHKAFE